MEYKATVYSLYLHDGFCWITQVGFTLIISAKNLEHAKTKVKSMTDLHFDLEELK